MSFSGVAKASPQLSCFLFPSIVNVLFQSIINILGIFYLVAPCCTHDIVSNCMSIQTSVLVFICLFVCFLLLLSVTVLHTMVVVVVCPSAREYKFAYPSQHKFENKAYLNTNLNTNLRISTQIENKFAQISKQSSCHTVRESNRLKMLLNLVNHQIIIFLEFLPSDG